MIRLFSAVSKSAFQMAYDGPALRSGAMDVNELASSLLAMGDLVREANLQLNGDRATVSLQVKSDFKRGSFEIALLLDHSFIEQAKAVLFPSATVGGAAIIAFLFGSETVKKGAVGIVSSALDVWKKLRGGKPKETIRDRGKGITIIVIGDGNEIKVDPTAATLYESDQIRSAIAGVVRPVSKEGIKSLDIKKGEKTLNQVQKSDLPPSDTALSTTDQVTRGKRFNRRETDLRVTRANFEKGKWGFSDGAASFSAEITDEDFKKRLDSREIGFYKGDTLTVVLAVDQMVDADGNAFHTTYQIEKVIEHRHSPKQQHLTE